MKIIMIKWGMAFIFFIKVCIVQSQLLRYYHNEQKDQYIALSVSSQFWARHTRLNPGSTINGQRRDGVFDLSIRRIRFKIYGQLSEKTSTVFTIGNNNLNRWSERNERPKLLDAYVTYRWKRYLGFGLGKSAWVGLSRYAAPATSSALSVDVPFSAVPLLNYSDHMLRKLNVYAFGRVHGFDYRLVLAKPYDPAAVPELTTTSSIAPDASNFQLSGYLKYHFKDEESQRSPFSTGTYLGEKEMLTIGIGSLYQSDVTHYLYNGDTVLNSAKSFAIDIFYENTFPRKTVVTIYNAYFYHDLGPGFLRQLSANNPSNGSLKTPYLNQGGNSSIEAGTGQAYLAQVAIMKKLKRRKGLQAYGYFEYAGLDALDEPLAKWGAGINYMLDGHKSKLTLGYQNWPVVKQLTKVNFTDKRRAMAILQYQLKME